MGKKTMKADFAEHVATFLLYPSRKDVWRKNCLPIRRIVCELCNTVSRFERVYLGTNIKTEEEFAPQVCAVEMDYDDIWIRDSGPIPVGNRLVAFNFNAWGGDSGLYGDWSKDLTVPDGVSGVTRLSLTRNRITLEGGNLNSDGRGTLIAIKPSVCDVNRNPAFDDNTVEEELKSALGIEKLIWLSEGLAYDETGGHTDNLCVFADEGKVLLAWTDDEKNPQYKPTRSAYETLSKTTDANGRKLKIIKIPLPKIFYRTSADCEGIIFRSGSKERLVGEPVQASYINFIFVNGGVIVPQFGDANDERVLKIFKNVFKSRSVIPFPAREIVLGGGGLHCITKNI